MNSIQLVMLVLALIILWFTAMWLHHRLAALTSQVAELTRRLDEREGGK